MKTVNKKIGTAISIVTILVALLYLKRTKQNILTSTENTQSKTQFIINVIDLQSQLRDISDLTHYASKSLISKKPLQEYYDVFNSFINETLNTLNTFSRHNKLELKYKLVFKRNKPNFDLSQSKYKRFISEGDNSIINQYLIFFKCTRNTIKILIKTSPNHQAKETFFKILKDLDATTEDLLVTISQMIKQKNSITL